MRKIYRGEEGQAAVTWNRRFEGRTVADVPVPRDDPISLLIQRSLPPGARILDAGCGLGGWLIRLRSLGFEPAGIDFVSSAVERIRDALPDLDVRQGDIRSLPWESDRFDAVLSLGVVEHFEEGPDDALRELVRVTRPGGLLFISVPYLNVLRKLQVATSYNDRHRSDGPFFQFAFSRAEFDALLKLYGAEADEHLYLGHLAGLRRDFPRFDRLYARLTGVDPFNPASSGRQETAHPRSLGSRHRLKRQVGSLLEHQRVGPVYGHMMLARART